MNYIYINPSISTCLKQNIDWLRTFPPNSFLSEPKAPLRKQFNMYYFPSNTIKLLASQNIPFNNFNRVWKWFISVLIRKCLYIILIYNNLSYHGSSFPHSRGDLIPFILKSVLQTDFSALHSPLSFKKANHDTTAP